MKLPIENPNGTEATQDIAGAHAQLNANDRHLPADAPLNHNLNHNPTPPEKFEIPQHILDFCNRCYPPHLGSAYDAARAHLVAKRMLIEGHLKSQMLSIESILSMLKLQNATKPSTSAQVPPVPPIPLPESNQPQPQQSHNDAATHPQQSHNDAATHPQQSRNDDATQPQQRRDKPTTKAQQQPPQNPQPTANQQPQPNNEKTEEPKKQKHNGHKSVIDSLPPQTQQTIADLLGCCSLDRAAFILSKPGSHGPALDLSRDVLHRFRKRILREQARARAAEDQQFVTELLDNPHASEDQLTAAIRHLFHTRILETIYDPSTPLADENLKALRLALTQPQRKTS